MCSVAMENMSSLARNSVATEYTTSVMRIREHTYVMLQQDAWRLLWNNTKLTVLIFLPDCLHQANILVKIVYFLSALIQECALP